MSGKECYRNQYLMDLNVDGMDDDFQNIHLENTLGSAVGNMPNIPNSFIINNTEISLMGLKSTNYLNKIERSTSVDVKTMHTTKSFSLSYMNTLNQYRNNIKKSNDSVVHYNFAKYLLEASLIIKNLEEKCNAKVPSYESMRNEGFKTMKKLASQSVTSTKLPLPDAQYFLGEVYSLGQYETNVQLERAFNYFLQSSKQNHPDSTYKVACFYENGFGIKKDPSRAVKFHRKAAFLGNIYAMHKLSLILQDGLLGQSKNPKEAMVWLKRASGLAGKDYPSPIHDLALCYEDNGSEAVIADEEYAYELFSKAATYGYPPSQYKIGYCHEYGYLRRKVDIPLAISWYVKASENNNKEALVALSSWYLVGYKDVLEQSDREAFFCARRSAIQGFHKAQYAMGQYYERAIGVEEDLLRAKEWYKKASVQGNKRATIKLQEIRKKIKSHGGKRKSCNII